MTARKSSCDAVPKGTEKTAHGICVPCGPCDPGPACEAFVGPVRGFHRQGRVLAPQRPKTKIWRLMLQEYHMFSPIKSAKRDLRIRCVSRRTTDRRPVRSAQLGFFSGGFERKILKQEKAQGSSHPCAGHTGRQRRPGKDGKTEGFGIACAKRTKGLRLVKSHSLCVTKSPESPSFRGLSG